MTAPDLPPVRPLGPIPGTTGGPTFFPATAPLIPLITAETMPHPFTLADDPDFPRGTDPALLGGYVEITPESVGLADDPVAHALWALGRLTPDQLAETLAYYQPALAGGMRWAA
ncbi:hypothetical protein [Micromonospora sp. RTGN7]|uniref:hypothetical protein n=1 Tax=Micromonospora sp. RTGN7 TaxID=3016526 RepID=UPI0029FECED6|nr:hypothetical protein [Micromonospora sp. RTGN7]